MNDQKIVVITDLRSAEAREAAKGLSSLGYDVRVPEGVCLWDEAALDAFARPLKDGLRGVIHPAPRRILGSVESASEEDWIAARDEGPVAAFCVTKIFCNLFREKRSGTIIYLNSIHAEKPVGHGALFSMGCGAVQMLCREVNQDYGTDGVNCFFVQRGVMEEDMDCSSDVSSVYHGVNIRYPQHRMPESDQLNGLLAFLLTDAAAPLTGADLRADGGMTMFYNYRRKPEECERHG